MRREHLGARAAWSNEEGFTLLELMMVVLIIAILIAVSLPTFLSATSRTKDRAVQSTLRNATTGAKSLYLANATYSTASPATLTAEIGNLTFVAFDKPPTTPNSVSVLPVPGNSAQIILAGQSKSGNCFYVLDDEAAGTTRYAKYPVAPGGCPANTITPADPAWTTTW